MKIPTAPSKERILFSQRIRRRDATMFISTHNPEVLNPECEYKLVFLGDRANLDGSRDFVWRVTGLQLKKLIELVG